MTQHSKVSKPGVVPPAWTRWGRYDLSRARYPVPKRVLDLGLVAMSLPAWGLVLAAVACLVRWKLGSPVLFRQERTGLRGAVFRMSKFRSMTEERDESGALLPDASRLGRFGTWLRASSLDELPEILCVMKGRMSLVGPRPLLPRYLGLYSEEQMRRHDSMPGLTGWAQVCGRNALSWEEKFRLDVWYVQNASLGLDAWILLLTVARVFRRDGIAAHGEATMPEFKGTASSLHGKATG